MRSKPFKSEGQPLPPTVRHQMETQFGQDFSDVRVHTGPSHQHIGALSFAQGNDIHIAPGSYDPHSPSGQKLIGHELTHVVQQRQGRVNATQQA